MPKKQTGFRRDFFFVSFCVFWGVVFVCFLFVFVFFMICKSVLLLLRVFGYIRDRKTDYKQLTSLVKPQFTTQEKLQIQI